MALIECKGSFQRLPVSEFTLDTNKQYSDLYLFRKGLWEKYGGVLDKDTKTPLWNEDGTPLTQTQGRQDDL